jgi:hypothetical protein
MIKNCLFAVALLSLALAGGCAKGGNGVVPPPPAIDVAITSPKNVNPGAIYPTQSLTLTATVSNATTTAVTWSLGPAATCTGTPNPCGTLTPVTPPTTPATATYMAPACVSQTTVCLSGAQPTVTATLAADTTVTGSLALTLVDITTEVAPSTLSVGNGLTQQFTAVAVPDDALQTFTWTCTASGAPCANFAQDGSGLAHYTPVAAEKCGNNCVQISAAAKLDPTGCSPNPKFCTIAKATVVTSRLTGNSTTNVPFSFRFSGYDNGGHQVFVAGTFTALNGGIVSGVEDEITWNGSQYSTTQHPINGGSYTPITSNDPNSNNAGTLALTLPAGVFPNQYHVALDAAGDIQMIESDGNGTGSGIAEPSSNNQFNQGTNQTFAFGFTGVDSAHNRVGYAGLMPTDGTADVTGGLIDVNDNGSSTNSTVVGTYLDNGNGSWTLTLTKPESMTLDFFVANGSKNANNPQTLYAISTDPVDSTHPAVLGTMVLQDSTLTYDIAHFKGTSVSALTGTVTGTNATCTAPPCANVSLTLGTTDGSGNFSGQFDQNNAGVILSAAQFPPTGSTSYTYAASGTTGRYTFNMLGDPTANPAKAPLPFVLYASGANRGFLLDQSSSSVMTGTMNPQGKSGGAFAASELPGTFGAATTSSGSSHVGPIAANLLLTFPGGGVFNVSGTQYQYPPGSQTVTGTLDLNSPNGNVGAFAIALTAPSAQNYVIYVLSTAGPCNFQQSPVCAIQSFLMMDVDKTNPNASIIFAQE